MPPRSYAAAALLAVALLPPAAAARSSRVLPHKAAVPTPVPSAAFPIVPPVAPGFRAPAVAPASADIFGVTQRPFVGIGLSDSIGMALLQNANLAVSSSNLRIARYRIAETKSAFDLNLHVEPSSSFSVAQPENLFFGGPGTTVSVAAFSGPATVYNPGDIIIHQSSFQYGLGGQTKGGLQYAAGIQQSRTYNNTMFNAYEPYYIASLNLSVTQPLLQNAGMNAAKRRLQLAEVNADATGAQALVDASTTISRVEDAYWDLVAAWRNVSIQKDALAQAVAQQESNVRLARRGAAAPIDAVESSTQVSNFQNAVFSSLQDVSALQNELKRLISSNPADPIWRANLVPTAPVLQLPAVPDLSTIVETALKNRPEVRQAVDQRSQADVDAAFARNQALPRADLQIGYMSNGFAGLPETVPPSFFSFVCPVNAAFANVCPLPPAQSRGTMAYAYHNLWSGAFPAFNVSFTVSFPLHNDAARGLEATAEQEKQQAAISMQGVDERIEVEARNALQAYQSALSRLYASQSAREAAEQVYASELRKFHNGASTTFLVLQRQVQLAQARGEELQAQTDLNKSVVELQRVEGTILTANGVNLQTLGSQALPH